MGAAVVEYVALLAETSELLADITGLIVCPACREPLRDRRDRLVCTSGHSYPVVHGVPRLVTVGGRAAAETIGSTFGRQWRKFRHEQDRTWERTVEERVAYFLADIDRPAAWLAGKRVLDAGCGNGVLSHAISELGATVLATDVSGSVEEAHRRYGGGSVHYIQSDLQRPIFARAAFDVVYSGGVLHHTPDTKASLATIAAAVRPGGILFVWLYWRLPGRRYRARLALRRLIGPLPTRAKTLVVVPVAALGWLLDRARRRRRNWREILIVELDFFTPRYRWEHTPDEVRGWLEELGFDRIEDFPGRDGFGVRAHR